MPTYEYQCKKCGHRFDMRQKIADPAPESCPHCQGGPIQKIFTSVGVIFKGSGFHINDYRKPEPKGESPAEGGQEKSEKSDSSKTETKTDTTTESKKTESKTESSEPKPSTTPASTPAG